MSGGAGVRGFLCLGDTGRVLFVKMRGAEVRLGCEFPLTDISLVAEQAGGE